MALENKNFKEQFYLILTGIFIASLVASNLIFQKFFTEVIGKDSCDDQIVKGIHQLAHKSKQEFDKIKKCHLIKYLKPHYQKKSML